MRVCTRCLKSKPLEAFAIEARTKCGRQSRCRACVAEYAAQLYLKKKAAGTLPTAEDRRDSARRYYEKNKATIKARVAKWQRENQGRHKANRVKNDTERRCKAKRRTSIRAENRAWREKNRDRVNAYWRDRNAKYPEQMVARSMKRHARKMNAPGRGVTADEWTAILESFDCRCAYCLAKAEKLEMDHVEALVRGGAHEPENVVPACAACNSSKKARPVFACFDPSLVVGERMGNHFFDAA